MLTATRVETYSQPLYTARSILLDDLDAVQVQLEVQLPGGIGIYEKKIRPFPRANMEPVVDDMIETIMAATKQSVRQELPGIETTVGERASDVTARMYLAAAGAGTALTLLLVAVAKRL